MNNRTWLGLNMAGHKLGWCKDFEYKSGVEILVTNFAVSNDGMCYGTYVNLNIGLTVNP
jgi:hypothetical protein